jgi:erythronate-4-phosphate dehydrogenase
MIVAADEVIPYVQAAFGTVGELRLFSGRSLRSSDLRGVDALIVRSITSVGADLLAGTSVRFVGTASIGMDHLDLDYLRGRGIAVANAAGSNANAVSEYVTAALLATAERNGWDLAAKSIGIIGVGHVGSLVEKKAAALGMEVMLCDPPLREATGELRYGFLDDVLAADVLTLHVPLTSDGPYPTRHMIDGGVLRRLSERQWLINTSRGAVVRGPDLKSALSRRRLGGAILDVWEGEPAVDRELLSMVGIGTAHVAGSSLDGKVTGTRMMLESLRRFFGVASNWDTRPLFPVPRRLRCPAGGGRQESVSAVVREAYNVQRDDSSLRRIAGMTEAQASEHFDRLRNEYELRNEFSHFEVEVAGSGEFVSGFSSLGFHVVGPAVAAGALRETADAGS